MGNVIPVNVRLFVKDGEETTVFQTWMRFPVVPVIGDLITVCPCLMLPAVRRAFDLRFTDEDDVMHVILDVEWEKKTILDSLNKTYMDLIKKLGWKECEQ